MEMWLKIRAAIEIGTVCSAECEHSSGLFLPLRRGIVEKACDEERKFGVCKLTGVNKSLPEGWSTSVNDASHIIPEILPVTKPEVNWLTVTKLSN